MKIISQCYLFGALLFGSLLLSGDGESKSFGAPEVIKLDWSTRALASSDLNGDGLKDLIVINNDETRIELLFQLAEGSELPEGRRVVGRNRWEPVLEDALFHSESITVGTTMFDLAAGDFNRDGRTDIAYTSRDEPLVIRFQNEEGGWLESLEFEGFEALGWTNTLKASDVDDDGFVELLVLSTDAIRIFKSNTDGLLGESQLCYITGENPFNFIVSDFNGDDRPDLFYLNNDGKQSLAVRKQRVDGTFGPELRQIMERPARVMHALPEGGNGKSQLVAVDSRSGFLEFLELRADTDKAERRHFGRPAVYPILAGSGQGAQYAIGDFDGDFDDDLVIATPDRAEISFLENEDSIFGSPRSFPSLSSVSSIASGRFFSSEADQLVVLSKEEKSLGLTHLEDGERFDFPENIVPDGGEPITVSAVDLDKDGYDELALVVSDESGDFLLRLIQPAQIDLGDSKDWEVFFEIELDDVRRDPESVLPLDVFAEDRQGLMITIPRKAPIILAPDSSGDATLRQIAQDSNVRESLLNGIDPAAVSVFDVTGDGVNELVVGRTGFARAVQFTDGELSMVEQFNAEKGDDVVGAVIPLFDGSRLEGLAFYISDKAELQLLERGQDGVFRYDRSEEVGPIDLVSAASIVSGKGSRNILFAGEDRLWVFGNSGLGRADSWQTVRTYETDLDEIQYSHVESADFDGNGVFELIALDGNNHFADVIIFEDESWRSQLFWMVFEANMHYQGRKGAKLEPRQILIDDLNGDSRLDLAFLVHDRLLIYPGR